VKVRRDWDRNPPKLLWKHPVGPAWSSFAVVGDLLYTQEQRREDEAVVCYRADTGEEVWAHLVRTRFNEVTGDGPRATPTFHKGRLYTLGATGVLSCLDARTGHEFWSTNILQDNGASNIPWGMAGSPLVYENLVVVSPGGPDGKSLVAYDRLTGERAWSAGSDPAAYSSPQWAVLDGVPQVLIFNTGGLSAHDPRTGAELWKFPWPSRITNNTIQPRILDGSTVLVSSIIVGTARLTITHEDGEWSVSQDWLSPRMKLYHNDMVSRDGFAYALNSGILTCLDLKTGEPKWKQGRYRSGQLLLLEDQNLLLIQGEFGDVILAEASSDGPHPIGRFHALDDKTWNHPVVAHGKLFVRNNAEAACYDVSPGGE
jgi:outer membrane protein assembly factor BamB